MRRFALLTAALALSASLASAQDLVCADSSPITSCSRFHYHLDVWSPEQRAFAELKGLNHFSTLPACEESRAASEAANAGLVAFLRSKSPRLRPQPNRFGPCHCDMTSVESSPSFLGDSQREGEVRFELETRHALLAELESYGEEAEAEFAGRLFPPSPPFPEEAWTLRPPFGGKAGGSLLDGTLKLKETTISPDVRDADWQSELRLAEVSIESDENAQQVAAEHPFVLREEASVQRVALDAAASDRADKRVTLKGCAERMKVLTNLGRVLASITPPDPLLDLANQAAIDPDARFVLLNSLFGSRVITRWTASEATVAPVDVPPDIAADPDAVLLDTSDRYVDDQRKLALYVFLTQNNIESSDLAWVRGLMGSYVR